MYNDEPTLLDYLDRKLLIEEVSEAIINCKPPQVFGVHGDWGLGKTSFLHQVQFQLTSDCPQQNKEQVDEARKCNSRESRSQNSLRAVWFDAWRFQYEDAPVVALLQEMRAQLSWGHQFARNVKHGAEIAVHGALMSIEEVTKHIGFEYSKFRDANRELQTKNYAVSLPSHVLREHLRMAIEKLLPKQKTPKKDNLKPRLVVFIDDLDRCEPEAAYRLLEGLKIYLTLENCVFVLGMNIKAVENAIGSRLLGVVSDGQKESHSDSDQVRFRAAAYMEKLCQNVWQLPAVRNPSKILSDLLKDTVVNSSIRDLIEQAIMKDQCLPPNPRRLKGLANLIGRLSQRLSSKTEEVTVEDARMLVIVAYIYQFHSDIYIRWEAESNFYNKIFDWCTGATGATADAKILDALILPKRIVHQDTDPTPSVDTKSTYPDPTETNVFWIQSLIIRMSSEVPPELFEPYFHSIST